MHLDRGRTTMLLMARLKLPLLVIWVPHVKSPHWTTALVKPEDYQIGLGLLLHINQYRIKSKKQPASIYCLGNVIDGFRSEGAGNISGVLISGRVRSTNLSPRARRARDAVKSPSDDNGGETSICWDACGILSALPPAKELCFFVAACALTDGGSALIATPPTKITYAAKTTLEIPFIFMDTPPNLLLDNAQS